MNLASRDKLNYLGRTLLSLIFGQVANTRTTRLVDKITQAKECRELSKVFEKVVSHTQYSVGVERKVWENI
jgi:hypothetical protein